jgi:hypothetical protein
MQRFSVSRFVVVVGFAVALGALGVAAAGASGGGRSPATPVRPAATGPCDGTIAFGEVISCTINTAGQVKDSTFAGSVVRPNGTTVCAATTSSDFMCQFDGNGNHTIVVRDFGGTGTGGYAVRVNL